MVSTSPTRVSVAAAKVRTAAASRSRRTGGRLGDPAVGDTVDEGEDRLVRLGDAALGGGPAAVGGVVEGSARHGVDAGRRERPELVGLLGQPGVDADVEPLEQVLPGDEEGGEQGEEDDGHLGGEQPHPRRAGAPDRPPVGARWPPSPTRPLSGAVARGRGRAVDRSVYRKSSSTDPPSSPPSSSASTTSPSRVSSKLLVAVVGVEEGEALPRARDGGRQRHRDGAVRAGAHARAAEDGSRGGVDDDDVPRAAA